MATTATTDVLIVGAGPTGLTMANLLVRNGVRVRIVDKKAGPAEESRALVVHAKTLELLDRLGLAELAIGAGQKFTALQMLNEGKRAGKLSFYGESERTPYPFALIYAQDQTEHLLLRGLGQSEIQVEWNTELLSLEQNSTGTRALVRHQDGSEESIDASWTIGADGSHSPVRHALSLGFVGESYRQALFLADVDVEGQLERGQAAIGFTHLGFLAFFPMPGEKHFRIIGALPLELRDRDTLTLEEVQQAISTYKGPQITISRARWISVYRTHHRMSKQFRVGRIFLTGDAAHIHSPAGGQGMNTGIGDAFNLAWKLALVIKGQAHETLLDSYEAERIPFARAILNGSDKAFQVQTMSQPIVQRMKIVGVPPLFRLVAGVPALRKWAFWYVSQLWTSYRTSPAVAQSAPAKKGTQAGDRAPYGHYEVGPETGQSIFTTIGGLDHHLLLFTGNDPATAASNVPELVTTLRSLVREYAAPIHLHVVSAGNRRLHELYDAKTPSIFLVRPDGHIAYRGPTEDIRNFQSYLDGLFVRSENHEQAPVVPRQENVIS